MEIPKVLADFETTLKYKVAIGDATFTLNASADDDGQPIDGLYVVTFDPGEASREYALANIATVDGVITGTFVTRWMNVGDPGSQNVKDKVHRKTGVVRITDYALVIIRQILNGEEYFPNPLKFTGHPILDADTDASDPKQVITFGQLQRTAFNVLAGNSPTITPGTAGETVAAGKPVYLKESDQRWYLTDTDVPATFSNVQLGIAQGAGTAGNGISGGVLLRGRDINQTGLTAGARYRLSATTGILEAATTDLGASPVIVGVADSTTSIIFDPGRFKGLTPGIAGEALTAGQAAYFKASDQKWWKADADAAATSIGVRIGVVESDASSNAIAFVRESGFSGVHSGLTPGTVYYLSSTAGAITATLPTSGFVRSVGIALSAQCLVVIEHNPYGMQAFGQEVVVTLSSSGVDAYVGTAPVPIPTVNGMTVKVPINFTNVGACSFNGVAIKMPDGSDPVSGYLVTGTKMVLEHDSSNWIVRSVSPMQVNGSNNRDLHHHSPSVFTATRDMGTASGAVTYAHGLGRVPKFVKITAHAVNASVPMLSVGTYDGTNTKTAWSGNDSGSTRAGTSTTNAVELNHNTGSGGTGYQTAVATWDATNVTLTWTKTSTPSSAPVALIFEAV